MLHNLTDWRQGQHQPAPDLSPPWSEAKAAPGNPKAVASGGSHSRATEDNVLQEYGVKSRVPAGGQCGYMPGI